MFLCVFVFRGICDETETGVKFHISDLSSSCMYVYRYVCMCVSICVCACRRKSQVDLREF